MAEQDLDDRIRSLERLAFRLAEEVVELKAENGLIRSAVSALLMGASKETYDSVVRSLRLLLGPTIPAGAMRGDHIEKFRAIFRRSGHRLLNDIENMRRRGRGDV
jgi:hypothetical protein